MARVAPNLDPCLGRLVAAGAQRLDTGIPKLRIAMGLALVLEALLIGTSIVLRPLDARLHYPPADARLCIGQLSSFDKLIYGGFNVVDFVFIGVYTALLLHRFEILFGNIGGTPAWPRWIAFLPGTFDFVETAGVAILLHGSARTADMGAWLAAIGTPSKWLASVVTATCLVLGEWRMRRPRKHPRCEPLILRVDRGCGDFKYPARQGTATTAALELSSYRLWVSCLIYWTRRRSALHSAQDDHALPTFLGVSDRSIHRQ